MVTTRLAVAETKRLVETQVIIEYQRLPGTKVWTTAA